MARERMRPNYLKAAFANVYNLSLLGGVTVASLATGEPWLLGVGVALEALWLLFATDNARFRRVVDSRASAEDRLENIRRMQEQAATLPTQERHRIQLLGARAAEVKAECNRNPRIAGEFIAQQLDRLDELVGEFVHLAVTATRCENYLARADVKQINRDREAQRRIEESATDDSTRHIARQNREILEKRLTITNDLEKFVARARGQMSLIENTVSLLRDQVMTMAEPEALGQQLDSLVASVDALREATQQADLIVGAPALESAPPELDRLHAALEQAGEPVSAEPSEARTRERRRSRT